MLHKHVVLAIAALRLDKDNLHLEPNRTQTARDSSQTRPGARTGDKHNCLKLWPSFELCDDLGPGFELVRLDAASVIELVRIEIVPSVLDTEFELTLDYLSG